MSLSVDIRKRLGSFTLDVAFTAEKGVTSLLGASGCGKSMTLKCIAGIEKLFQEQLKRLRTDYVDYYLMHMLNDADTWQRLREMGIEVPEDRIIQVGPSIGSHIGPNACGIVYVQE